MRKLTFSLLCALLLTSSLVMPVLAQDSPLTPPVLCGDLATTDCDILKASAEVMQTVSSYAFATEYNVFLTGIPEMEVDTVDITFGADGMLEVDPESMAAMKSLTEASMAGDAEAVQAVMADLPATVLDFYRGLGFDGTIRLTMPEEVAALISEDSDVPFPADLTLAFRIVDGMFYMRIADLKAHAPELEEYPSEWIGFDLVGLMEQGMAAGDTSQMDATSMAQSMIFAGLANQMMSAMEQFVTVERLDDADVAGQTAAVFQSSVDMVDFFGSNEFASFVRDMVVLAGADDAQTTAEIDQGLMMVGLMAPMIFGGMEVDNLMTIGLDDYYLYAQDFSFSWDLSQLLGLAAMSDPALAEALGDAEPLIEFAFTSSFDQFNEDFDLTAPDDVEIIPLEDMAPDTMDAVF